MTSGINGQVEKRCDFCSQPMILEKGDKMALCSNGEKVFMCHTVCGRHLGKAFEEAGLFQK